MSKAYSIARFKAAWASEMRAAEIAVEFGITTRTVGERAKALGLPSRKGTSRALKIPVQIKERMIDMRRFGLAIRDIGTACGISSSVTQRFLEATDLPRLPRGRIPQTLADYHQHKMAIALAASAAQTRRIEAAMAKHNSKNFPRDRHPQYLAITAQT